MNSNPLGVRRHVAALSLGDMSPSEESADMSAHSKFATRRLKFAAPLRNERGDMSSADPSYIGMNRIESWTGRLLEEQNDPNAAQEVSSPESTTNRFENGDVLLGKLRPYLAKAWLADRDGCSTTEFLVLSPTDVILGAYLRYLILRPSFITEVDASTFGAKMPRANWDFIGGIHIPIPTISTQHRIASYLDRETARIDALVAEKERMLSLLEQKRAALISRAVIRGLNPKAPTKPSGLDWLGEIPTHWNIRRVKYLIEALTQGSSPQASSYPAEANEFGVLKLSAISRGRFKRSENKAPRITEDEEIHPDSLSVGDVLVTRSNTPSRVGDACCVPEDEPNLLIPDLVYRLRVKRHYIMPEFLVNHLLTASARTEIIADARGSSGTMVKISQDHVSNWKIPVPPLEEQEAIISHIQAHQARATTLESILRDSIVLLKERRSALITAAVTGKITV